MQVGALCRLPQQQRLQHGRQQRQQQPHGQKRRQQQLSIVAAASPKDEQAFEQMKKQIDAPDVWESEVLGVLVKVSRGGPLGKV